MTHNDLMILIAAFMAGTLPSALVTLIMGLRNHAAVQSVRQDVKAVDHKVDGVLAEKAIADQAKGALDARTTDARAVADARISAGREPNKEP